MGSTRDTQKSRLYRAERAAEMGQSETARRIMVDAPRVASTGSVTIEACQRYVDHLTQSAWFQRRWGRKRYTVRHKAYGKATHSSGWHGSIISLPPWARDEWTILHEVAHGLTEGYAAHGPEFAGAYLALVEHRIGKAAATSLRAHYKAERVRHTMARIPKPSDHRIRPVDNPVKVPSAATADRHAAARAEREAAAEAKRLAKVAAGFRFGRADDAERTVTSGSWFAIAAMAAKQAAGRVSPEEWIDAHGVETTPRGRTVCVRWDATEVGPNYWRVALTDRLTGEVRHTACVSLAPAEVA